MGKISVIVPVYNAEEHIKDCIGSILKQSYTNFELLLINDGSTDNSLEICHELSLIDDRIRLINQINKGASAARNRGLYASTGEWVVFVDVDDIVREEYLSNMIGVTEDTSTDFVVGGIEYYYTKENKHEAQGYSQVHWTGTDVVKALSEYKLYEKGGPTAKLYKNKILKDNNIFFNPDLHFAEDCDFMLRYFTHINAITFIDSVDYIYCIRQESLSHRRLSYNTEAACLHEMILRYKDIATIYGVSSLGRYKSSVFQYYIRTLQALSFSKIQFLKKYGLTKALVVSCKNFYSVEEYSLYQPYCRHEKYLLKLLWIANIPLIVFYCSLTNLFFFRNK